MGGKEVGQHISSPFRHEIFRGVFDENPRLKISFLGLGVGQQDQDVQLFRIKTKGGLEILRRDWDWYLRAPKYAPCVVQLNPDRFLGEELKLANGVLSQILIQQTGKLFPVAFEHAQKILEWDEKACKREKKFWGVRIKVAEFPPKKILHVSTKVPHIGFCSGSSVFLDIFFVLKSPTIFKKNDSQ
ncbi:hypothetical protein JTE90_004426 [Oedothorax gibbosus]|uniref:Uncharacterized protein n=1 Tax=Oedothorax gibbosus TaxID=931172 RepID=A0AAV6TNA0_9ARAC|nr:hypothetical protein JTE90_004426 [Oedothorax gibbosus]